MRCIDKDVAVIGLGVMGAMSLWRLAERGVRTIGIEQFGIAHDRGSSHGGTRIFRQLVFEGLPYVPIVERALELWRELEARSDRRLLTVTGGISIGTVGAELLREAMGVADQAGLEIEILDADGIRRRFPQHAICDDDAAVFEPGAGVLAPEAAIVAATTVAAEQGAEILTETPVQRILPDGERWRIETPHATILCHRAIVATGAWFNDLLPHGGLPVRNQRSILHWFRGRPTADYGPGRFPVFIRESRDLNGWGIPDVDGRGVKVGISGYPKAWLRRPEDNWSAPTPDDTAPVEKFCREAFVGLDPHPDAAVPCMNSKTPDGDFIIGESAVAPGLILLGGFSGHGFKHASAIGEIAADLATEGESGIAIDAFSPDRFGPDPWSLPAVPLHEPTSCEGV